jgi:transposase-like protein
MIGGVETGRKGRSKGKKRKIQIAAEVGYPEDDKPAYLKRAGAYMIDDFSATSLGKGLRNMVHKDAVITTDGWSGYQPVAKDFWHEVFLSNKGDNFKLLHWHIFNLKNWIRGVHHKISRAHLQSYLDEYHFRFNSRNHLKSNPNLVLSLMVNHDWFPYKQAKGT